MVYREKIKLQSRDRAVSFHDVTEQVKEAVKRSGVKDGIAVVYSHHTTCSVKNIKTTLPLWDILRMTTTAITAERSCFISTAILCGL